MLNNIRVACEILFCQLPAEGAKLWPLFGPKFQNVSYQGPFLGLLYFGMSPIRAPFWAYSSACLVLGPFLGLYFGMSRIRAFLGLYFGMARIRAPF